MFFSYFCIYEITDVFHITLSFRLSTDNSQRTTGFFHRILTNKKQHKTCTVSEPVEGTISGASTSSATAYPRTVDGCTLSVDINYNCAKAHYYHAVGLTEKEDIVGACEHYLIALEIMEEMMAKDKRLKAKGIKVQSSQIEAHNYECKKIRFISLIHTRLGELFYNESYCHLSIIQYKKTLSYIEMLNNYESKSQIYKLLGNSYQLLNISDSALYYYNKSLETNSNHINKLDVEKSIALILFNNGTTDSAFTLVKSNLCKIDNIHIRDSYYTTIGGMFYDEHEYDSAIYYLEKSVKSDNNYIKHQSSLRLSAIYDSIDDHEKKSYYEKIVSELSMNMVNKSIIKGELQDRYDNYKNRKYERKKLENIREKRKIVISLSSGVIFLFIVIILLKYRFNKKKNIFSTAMNEMRKGIIDKEEIISKTNEEIKRNESEIKKLVEKLEGHRSNINLLESKLAMKQYEISCKETVIKNMENDLSAKERELKRFQANVYENSIVIEKFKEDCKTNEELIAAYIEEIEKFKTEISETQKNLIDLRFKNSFTEGKIKKQNAELKNKEELVNKYMTEIAELKDKLDIISPNNDSGDTLNTAGIVSYLQSKICSKILCEINDLSAKNKDVNILTPLRHDEFVMLLNSANLYVNNFTNGIINKYCKLKKEDLYYLSLSLMGMNEKQISSLFGVTYNAIKKRRKRICYILGVQDDQLKSFLMQICC